ncbi:MAG: DUF2961 domain-containing protein [bacterium]
MARNHVGLLLLVLILSSCVASINLDAWQKPKPAHESSGDRPVKSAATLPPSGLLGSLIRPMDFEAFRESSWDRTGDNLDCRDIDPGETLVLCDLEGPGVITHIWCTVAGEEYNSRKIILRAYWDGAEEPSIEAPLGDFFCVGHGIDRPVKSLPVGVSQNGRARNCFWPMPFRESARLEVESHCVGTVRAFYYHIDYKKVADLPKDTLYFHARYRQEWPCPKVELNGKNLDGAQNYLLLETEGRGQYVGCNLSMTNNAPGWWGEGDDFVWVDGECQPQFIGTGSEDYFCDAWGVTVSDGIFFGCTLCEGFDVGNKSTAYRFHIADPIPFTESIRVSIEHGHANDRADDFSSVAYWYQDCPFDNSIKAFSVPPVRERLSGEALAMHDVAVTTQEVLKLLAEGEDRAATAIMTAALERHSEVKNVGPLYYLDGMRLETSGQIDKAKEHYESVAEKQPNTTIGRLASDAVWRLDGKNRATMSVTCDDVYTVYLDGVEIGTDSHWVVLKSYKNSLSPGKHVVAVKTKNVIGASGLVFSLKSDKISMVSDRSWKVTREPADGWNQVGFDDRSWDSATVYCRGMETPAGVLATPDLIGIPLNAEWIWADENRIDGDIVYFRKTFEVSS